MLAIKADQQDWTPTDSANKGIGSVIRCARRAANLSGMSLAKMTGLSRRTIIKIEQGDPTVAFGSYLAVTQALNIDWMLDVFVRESAVYETQPPKYYLSGITALSLPTQDGRPPALWYSSSLSNPGTWRIAGKHLAHTGPLLGVTGLWDAAATIARYGVHAPCIWAASPERAVFDLLVDHCEWKKDKVPNVQVNDIDDVVDLKQVSDWVEQSAPFLSDAARLNINSWLNGGYR